MGLNMLHPSNGFEKNEDKLVESKLAFPKPLGTLWRRVSSGQFPFKEIFLCLCLVAYNRNSPLMIISEVCSLYGTRLEKGRTGHGLHPCLH